MASRQSEEDAQEAGGAPATTTPHGINIIPSLPLETRWPPFALRRYGAAGGFWLPEVTAKEGLPAVHSSCFAARPTDVILASFPKSGTTWLKALAFATLKRSAHPPPSDGDHPLRHRSPHECVRFLEIELSDSNKDEFEALPSPRVLATHLPYSLLPGSITGGGGGGGGDGDGDGEEQRSSAGCRRIVYVCREPKDALVSYWLFTRKAAPARGADARSFTIQEASELFCDGRCPGGPQWLHVLQYWEESVRRPDRVLFLRYEEMLLEPESHVRKLAKFMDCAQLIQTLSPSQNDSASQRWRKPKAEHCMDPTLTNPVSIGALSLGKLRDMEVNRNGSTGLGTKNESFFRKGVAGDWSNHMTPEMAQRLDKVVEDALQGTGFAFTSTSQELKIN